MSNKATTIRVKPYTKELIIKHSRAKKITQNDLVEMAILVAEKMNFKYDLPLKQIEKKQVTETNRLIGFLKTQDKNLEELESKFRKRLQSQNNKLKQTEQNIYLFFKERLREDRREVLEYLFVKTLEEIIRISDEYYKDRRETKERFITRFKDFFAEAYETLKRDINQIK